MKIYLIPTPIADDVLDHSVVPQTLAVIGTLKYFLVENIRTARRFIASLGQNIIIDELHFTVLDKDSDVETIENFIKHKAAEGIDLGILSEAGCPGFADPGALAVEIGNKYGYEIAPLVGPSSILLALMGSGLNGQSFTFHGYTPIEKTERFKFLQKLDYDSFKLKQTQIFMETPYRNNALFEDVLAACSNDTWLCVGANLMAKDQLLKTMQVKNWKKQKPELHKKPAMFLIQKR